MSRQSPERFGQLLTKAIRTINAREDKGVGIIQEELGYAIGVTLDGIRYWRRGHIPTDEKTVENLAKELFARAGFENRKELEQFLRSADYLNITELCDDLFPQGILPIPSAIATSVNLPPTHLCEDWDERRDVTIFYGRQEQLNQLTGWIIQDQCRLIVVLGLPGIGKTRLVTKLVHQIKGKFDCVIWRTLINARPLEKIVEECINIISNQQRGELPENVDERILMLLRYLEQRRCLLILDNLETILRTGDQVGSYREGYEKYGDLIRLVGDTAHQSCLILTSREVPKEVAQLEGPALPTRLRILEGLPADEGRKILRDKGLLGSDAPDDEANWRELITRYSGNPQALELVSPIIRNTCQGNIAQFLKIGEFMSGEVGSLLNRQFERSEPLEQAIMYWLTVEREPVAFDALLANLVPHPSKKAVLEAIYSLQGRSLIELTPTGEYRLPNVVMEFVTDRLIDQVCHEIITGSISLFRSHALTKAQAKEYIRQSQIELILKPVTARLLDELDSTAAIEQKLKDILANLRKLPAREQGYAGGNALNLLAQLNIDLRGYDFSHLTVWQGHLQGLNLQDINFAQANLANCTFTETFSTVLSVTFSPNGQFLAAGISNGEVRLWQSNGVKQISILKGHLSQVRSVVFSPDSSSLASGSDDHALRRLLKKSP